MEHVIMLDAPQHLFDQIPSLLHRSGFQCVLTSRETKKAGVRQQDTATYEVRDVKTQIDVYIERRAGNTTMSISVMPVRRSFLRRDHDSEHFARQVANVLLSNGAKDVP